MPSFLSTIWEYQQADWLTEWVWMEIETHWSEIETFKLTLNIPILVSISFRFVSLFCVPCFSSFFPFLPPFMPFHFPTSFYFYAFIDSIAFQFNCSILVWKWTFHIFLPILPIPMLIHGYIYRSELGQKISQNRFTKQCKYQIKKFQYTQSFSNRFADFISLSSFAHLIYILIWFLCIKGIENASDSEEMEKKTHFAKQGRSLNSMFSSRYVWNCIFLPKHMFGVLEGI